MVVDISGVNTVGLLRAERNRRVSGKKVATALELLVGSSPSEDQAVVRAKLYPTSNAAPHKEAIRTAVAMSSPKHFLECVKETLGENVNSPKFAGKIAEVDKAIRWSDSASAKEMSYYTNDSESNVPVLKLGPVSEMYYRRFNALSAPKRGGSAASPSGLGK